MSDGPVTLREITPDNEAAVRALKVAPSQEQFVTSVPVSLDEAKRSPDANPQGSEQSIPVSGQSGS